MLQFIFTNYYVEFSIKKCAWQKMKQGAYKTKMIRIQGCAIVTSWMCMMYRVTYKVISSLLFRVLYHEFCVSTVVQSVMKLKNRCEENSLDKNI